MTVFATITDLVSGKIYALRRKEPAGSNVKFFLGVSFNFLRPGNNRQLFPVMASTDDHH